MLATSMQMTRHDSSHDDSPGCHIIVMIKGLRAPDSGLRTLAKAVGLSGGGQNNYPERS